MTPKELIDAFEVLADAPDGIARLRDLVMRLAVQGRLVPQDSADEPACDLLARIDREQLVTSAKGLSPVKETDPPWEIPETWDWVRLRRVVDFSIGKTPPTKNPRFWADAGQGYAWVGIADMSHYGTVEGTSRRVTEAAEQEVFRGPPKPEGTIILSFKLTIGKIARLGCPAYHNEAIISVFPALPELDPFLYRFLPVFAGESATNAAIKGATLNKTSLTNLLVALPPISEQRRIAERVDELMAFLDRLEAAQALREATRQALRDAALSALRDADDPEALHEGWTRIANRMDCLFNGPSDITPLREAILQLAVRGYLVAQDSGDEPADKLLGRIARPRGAGESCDGDAAGAGPFRLPDLWAWSTLDELGEIKGGGTPSKKEPRFWGGDIPWVSPKDMKRPYIGDSIDTVTPEAVEQTSVKEIGSGALLMVVRGMILAHSFPTALTTRSVTVNQDMKALILAEKEMGPYLLLATNGLKPEVLKLVERSTHGTCKLPTAKLFWMPIPIPPLAEQHRIVAKVNELMALCDDLEARLRRARETRVAFASSAVASFA